MINGIGVHIKANNFQDSLNFYTKLGFKKVFEYGPEKDVKESYNGVVFEHGGCKLEIGEGHIAVKPEVFKQKVTSSKISLMIQVESLSEVIKVCKANNFEIAVSPRHYYWGNLEMVLKDPDGTVLVFVTPYSENEAKTINADEFFSIKK